MTYSALEGERSLGVVEFSRALNMIFGFSGVAVASRADSGSSPVEVVLRGIAGGGALGTAVVVLTWAMRGSDSIGVGTRAF